MPQHAQIEEVSDSEPSDMDPSDFDPAEFGPSPILPTRTASTAAPLPEISLEKDYSQYAHFQCLYPVYFDCTRSRRTGRRVPLAAAVPNPLAREIVDAVAALGLRTLFEPGKTHPKDWANPGRVRVLLARDGRAVNPRVKNKHHLYNLVAEYLRAHPTTAETPLRLHVPNLPVDPAKPPAPPAVPRGWKMGTILPTHSPALSGGGVSENFLKEMMGEMQKQAGGAGGAPAALLEQMGGLGFGGPGGGGGGEKRKKEKRRVIRA